MDAYFKRITDIIKKGKIPACIKFMLQDVQELRDNEWVPRVRQDKQLEDERDCREREREKVDHSKLQDLLSRRAKEKSGALVSSLSGWSQ